MIFRWKKPICDPFTNGLSLWKTQTRFPSPILFFRWTCGKGEPSKIDWAFRSCIKWKIVNLMCLIRNFELLPSIFFLFIPFLMRYLTDTGTRIFRILSTHLNRCTKICVFHRKMLEGEFVWLCLNNCNLSIFLNSSIQLIAKRQFLNLFISFYWRLSRPFTLWHNYRHFNMHIARRWMSLQMMMINMCQTTHLFSCYYARNSSKTLT